MKPPDLFTKLDSIRVDATSEISSQDRHFCEALQERYERAARAFAQVTALARQIVKAVDWPEEDDVSEGWRVEQLSGELREHAEKIQQEIMNNRDRYFIEAIVEYFEREYHLEFTFELEQRNRRSDEPKKVEFCALPRKNGILHWQDIVRVLLRKSGVNGFGNAGKQRIIAQFRSFCVRNYDHTPQMVARLGISTLKLARFWIMESDFMSKLRVSWRGREDVAKIFHAFQYFEDGELSLSSAAKTLLDEMSSARNQINFAEAVVVPFKKVEAIKIYKSHRLDIRFKDKDTREAFIEMFNLGHLIEEQKNIKS